jgi:hypothetical protein
MKALLLAAALALLSPAAAAASDAINVPAGNKLYLQGHAVGVQIYACNGSAWTLTGPRATLYKDNGTPFITHFAGPTWQHKDGSTVVGQLAASPMPVDPTAIPWLLLSAKSTAPGVDGDRLVRTTDIQRVNTAGGLAPAASTCSAETAGTMSEVPYTADYRFWR